ncbi:hypothetical protein BaRGS_00005115 [Batillaria attramentaria]|uniref:Uncharacterized protein n=1 Tax=Batillaria attramentaria TaxID=370345 RepID=A0ABD0LVR4_9CAEN
MFVSTEPDCNTSFIWNTPDHRLAEPGVQDGENRRTRAKKPADRFNCPKRLPKASEQDPVNILTRNNVTGGSRSLTGVTGTVWDTLHGKTRLHAVKLEKGLKDEVPYQTDRHRLSVGPACCDSTMLPSPTPTSQFRSLRTPHPRSEKKLTRLGWTKTRMVKYHEITTVTWPDQQKITGNDEKDPKPNESKRGKCHQIIKAT